jgi:hypothetical protein
VVYDGGYVDQGVLKVAWAEITGGSFMVDVKDVYDARGAVNYLLKDLLKAPKIRPEDLAVFDQVFKGSHMIQPFGPRGKTKYKVIRHPVKCPLCGGTAWTTLDPLFDERRRPSFWYDGDGLSPPFSELYAVA